MQKFLRPKAIALLLIPALAFGPIGCGPEAIPILVSTCAVIGVVAYTIHEVQVVQAAQIDIEMQTLKLQGMKDGQPASAFRQLTSEDVRKVAKSGKLEVNGKVLHFRAE